MWPVERDTLRVPRIHTLQALSQGISLTLDEASSHHVRQVLRLRMGDPLILFTSQGEEYAARLTQVSKQGVQADIGEQLRNEPAPTLGIHLMLGISRGERMDFALQKATELGVTRITPLLTQRCVVKLDEKKRSSRMDHWHKVVIHACEQSGRCRVPQFDAPLELSVVLGERLPGCALLLDHRSVKTLADLSKPEGSVSLLIGPEGGLAPEEREQACGLGFQGVRLGPRVLRTETAPLAAIAAIQALWGDFC
ncbi:MAG: 16S rRNA (uracil(1498)-N(3))-methyltransferase [Candidatus Thiodiazotropha sp.]